jgi:hypothetical protein
VKRPGSRMNPRYRPRPLYLWLALLTFLAVFAATAGARQTLASRTQAVRADGGRHLTDDPDHHRLSGLA